MDQNLKKSKPQQKKPPLSSYVRYSGMAFQMGFIIIAGVFGGLKLDKLFNLRFPVFTVILSMISVVLAIYLAVKELIRYK